ncbi:carbohydrate ABC transporter permease [uncultured Alsobacter sp.]|uniref:carbohydrate ABC transporter permease n=1 Tax=uncultured Alsobacter sp. TaxID=1748258 RepID=UPI0025EDFB13|nr:sugar ABC transporter permease [uncultured Alsobacter sp.]
MSASTAQTTFPVSALARRGGLKAGERRIGWLFLLPAVAAFVLVIAVPFLRALGYAFTRYDLQTPEPVFIGLGNFRALAASPEVLGSFVTTLLYVVLATGFTVILGLAWAIVLNQTFRGRAALRAMSLLPWVLPSTVCAFVWGWIFNSRFGLLNAVLLDLGLIPFPTAWLSTTSGAMSAIVVTKVWLSIPLYMSFFLAGLQGLDREQIDAARVDGAGNLAILRDHVLPHLRPVLLVVVVLGVIGNLQQFDTIFALTGGGPVRATTVLSIEVYRRAFDQWDVGMAAAIGLLWVATILPAAYLYLRHLLKGV